MSLPRRIIRNPKVEIRKIGDGFCFRIADFGFGISIIGPILLFTITLPFVETDGKALGGDEAAQSGQAKKLPGKLGVAPADVAQPSFQDDIRPLLEAKCSRCHGGKTRRKDLDLRSPAGILKGSESGSVIAPGKPDETLLFEKVRNGKMPPAKKDRLSATEVETIRRWIASGAKFGPRAGAARELEMQTTSDS